MTSLLCVGKLYACIRVCICDDIIPDLNWNCSNHSHLYFFIFFTDGQMDEQELNESLTKVTLLKGKHFVVYSFRNIRLDFYGGLKGPLHHQTDAGLHLAF